MERNYVTVTLCITKSIITNGHHNGSDRPHRRCVTPLLHMSGTCRAHVPSKVPLPVGGSGTRQIFGSLGPHEFVPKLDRDRFSHCSQRIRVIDVHTTLPALHTHCNQRHVADWGGAYDAMICWRWHEYATPTR